MIEILIPISIDHSLFENKILQLDVKGFGNLIVP